MRRITLIGGLPGTDGRSAHAYSPPKLPENPFERPGGWVDDNASDTTGRPAGKMWRSTRTTWTECSFRGRKPNLVIIFVSYWNFVDVF